MVREFATATQCAARVGVSEGTWREWVRAGLAPEPSHRQGVTMLWRARDVDAFIITHGRSPVQPLGDVRTLHPARGCRRG